MITVNDLLNEATRDGRVCPQPHRWNDFWKMLPNKTRTGAEGEPSPPLILAAWDSTPHISKIVRFQEHIRWAGDNGALQEAYDYLLGLQPEDWYYGE